MILKAILLGLVAMLGHTNFLFGTNLLDRPLIMCTLTGLVMGDLKSGIIIGAMMELAFIGAFSVGASLPPDMISGGVLGAALTLAAGNDPEVALTIGVPIASLALLMKNACKIFILPIFVHKADDYAVKGNSKGVARMHMLGGFLYLNLPYGIFVFLAFLLGNTVIQSVLDAIPQFVKSGLTIATGLMPALGFAVLASMIINKKNWYFLLLGFLISAYMGMSVTGVALFATVRKVFFRSFPMEWTWNYEKQQNLGYTYALIPIIEKLYKDKPEEKAAALQRHLEFFNTTPHMVTLILGISTAMEEENALDENFDTSSINSVKAGLMGPLAGIGDSFMWGTLRIIATGIGTSLAMNGNILGPILFFLLFNIPHVILRYICMMGGYKFGAGFLSKIAAGGLMEKLTYAASILGLMSIGSMIATMVTVNIPLKYTNGDTSVVIADVINGIVPCLLPLLFTGFIYWLVTKKKMKTTWALILIFIIGILGSLTGILGV